LGKDPGVKRALLLVACLADAGVASRGFDPGNTGLVRTFAPGGEPTTTEYSADGRFLAVAAGAAVRIYETHRWREVRRLADPPQNIQCVAFSPDGKLLAGGGFEGAIALWDAESGQLLSLLRGHSSYVEGLAFGLRGKTLLSGSLDGSVKVWDAERGSELKTLAPLAPITAVAFSADGRRAAAAGQDGSIKVWKVDSWAEERTLRAQEKESSSIAFSPDGRKLAAGGEGDFALRIWDVENGRVERKIDGHASEIASVRFLGEGRFVLTASELSAIVWDARSGRELARLKHHTGPVVALAVHPSGRSFVTVGKDHHLKVWGPVPGGMSKVRGKGFCGIRVDQSAEGLVTIREVIPASAAEAAGFQVGDILRKVGGVAITNPTESVDQISSYLEGDEVEFGFERAGEARTLKIRLGKRPENLDR
jgi:WD40 repeat protein